MQAILFKFVASGIVLFVFLANSARAFRLQKLAQRTLVPNDRWYGEALVRFGRQYIEFRQDTRLFVQRNNGPDKKITRDKEGDYFQSEVGSVPTPLSVPTNYITTCVLDSLTRLL